MSDCLDLNGMICGLNGIGSQTNSSDLFIIIIKSVREMNEDPFLNLREHIKFSCRVFVLVACIN